MPWSQSENKKFRKLKKRLEVSEEQNAMLKETLEAVRKETEEMRKENNFLRTQINVLNYQRDSLNQYGRKECFQLNKSEEKANDDPTAEIIEKSNFILQKIDEDGPFKEFKGKRSLQMTSKDVTEWVIKKRLNQGESLDLSLQNSSVTN